MRVCHLLAGALLLAGCGSSESDPRPSANEGGRSDRLVDFSEDPPFINSLDVDPGNGDFLLTTNRGFWRITKAGRVSKVTGRIEARGKEDTVGTFLEIEAVGGRRLVGSGHPDHENTLSQYLGFIESTDMGKTWRVVSRLEEADLHKVLQAHGRIYGYDAITQTILITTDGGRTFEERATPRELIIDFVVDPEDPQYILASTEEQLYSTEDGGETWRPGALTRGIRLAWPAAGALYQADADGTIYTSPDKGRTWEDVGTVDGEPYKWETTDDPKNLYLALSDGTIVETRDGGRTFEAAFTP